MVDLGASQTVIGSKQVPELLESIPETIRKQIKKTSCNLVFRFGNHQTLTSRVALILPVHRTWFRVAIVPGPTPFLLSSSFLRTIQAVIDAEDNTLWSKKLGKFLETTKSSSNLMLLDINQLWPQDAFAVQDTVQVQGSNPIQSIQTAELISKGQPAATASPIDAEQCVTGRATELSNLIKPNPNEMVKVEETTEVTFSEERICPKQSTDMDVPAKPSSSQADSIQPLLAETHHVSQSEACPLSGRNQEGTDPGRSEGHRPASYEHAQDHDHQVRQSQTWPTLRGGFPRPGLDKVVRCHLREQQEDRAPHLPAVCLPPSGGRSEHANEHQEEVRPVPAPFCSGTWETIPGSSGRDFNVGSRRTPVRGDLGTPTTTGSSDEPNRKCFDGHHAPHRKQDRTDPSNAEPLDDGQGGAEVNRAVIEQICHLSEVACNLEHAELDFDFDDRQPQEYNRMCSQYLAKFREEFQHIANVIKPHPQRAFLFEIMCSKDSELTRQGAKQGLQVKRFGLEDGDLRTKIGRRNLFCHLARDRPEHVWISPTCGPWCQWSNSQYEQKC